MSRVSRRKRLTRLTDLHDHLARQRPTPTSLTQPHLLALLLEELKDPLLVHQLVSRFTSWEEFQTAHPHDVLAIAGTAALHVRTRTPAPVDVPVATHLITRYQTDYPAGLLTLPTPPVLLYATGIVPEVPALAIIGPTHATSSAVHWAREAATSAVVRNIPVVAVVDDQGVGFAALDTVCELGGTPIGVIAGDVSCSHLRSELAHRIRKQPAGVCVSETAPTYPWTPLAGMVASALAVGLSHVVVACDPGLHPGGGAVGVRTAIATSRALIVPQPPGLESHTSLGTQVLVNPSVFTPEMFGTNIDMTTRAAAGLSPVDYTPATASELDHHVSTLFPRSR